jgi:hypothetical protein
MGDITTQTPSLGRTYALSGDTAKSRTAYKDVVALWKDADPDIPILIAGRLSDPMSTVGCPARRHRPPTMRASVCKNSAHSRTACDEHLASDQSTRPMLGSVKFGLVVLLAAAALVVLITPATDELPCTIGKRCVYQPALLSITTILPLVNLLCSPAAQPFSTGPRMSRLVDILSSNCTFVC